MRWLTKPTLLLLVVLWPALVTVTAATAPAAGFAADQRSADETPVVYTRQELLSVVPRWPNPYRAFLPAGADPDMAYWRARMQMEGHDRRLARMQQRSHQAAIEIDEAEPPGVLLANDLPVFAQPVDGFGTTVGEVHTAVISGHLRQLPLDLGSSAEPDGAIGLALPIAVSPGERVVLGGEIGDGLYGSATGGTSGDFDFFAVWAEAGQVIEVIVRTPLPMADLDPIAALYDATGSLLALNDNLEIPGFLTNLDSYLSYNPSTAGTYLVMVGGRTSQEWEEQMLPADPFDPASGPGVGSEGTYRVTIGLDAPDPGDIDFYRVELRAGDVLGATVSGASRVTLRSLLNEELVGSGHDLSAIYPTASPLPGGGEATIARVIDTTGTYAVGVEQSLFSSDGSYRLELLLSRPPLEGEVFPPAVQVLFLDLDGAEIDRGIFDPNLAGPVSLSPLSAFLNAWGLTMADYDGLVDAIAATVNENLLHDVRLRGGNGDYLTSGIPGEFAIEVRNSRDHADPFGQPHVSRVVIGGTIAELGLSTIGLAESIDPGNFATGETAVVLLDLLSAGADNPNSLNGVERSAGTSMVRLLGVALGNIAAHEAGHLLANFHTERDEGPATIMDSGGRLDTFIGLGEDEVFGTADDLDVDLGPDRYATSEVFTGVQNTLQAVSFDLPAGGWRLRLEIRPAACDLGAVAVGTSATCHLALSNEGELALRLLSVSLSGADSDQFALSGLATGASLPPGQVLPATITFTPSSAGAKNASLDLQSNDPGRPLLAVPLQGQGGVPAGAVVPTAHDFGSIVYGDAGQSITAELLVSSSGAGPLQVSYSPILGATPGRFRIDDGSAPFVLAPGESRTVTVSFAPAGETGPSSALLRLATNQPDSPWLEVALTGDAFGPDIAVNPDTHFHYGAILVGGSNWRRFAVTNLGNRDLQVSATTLGGDNAAEFSISNGGPFTLSPGQSTSIQVWCQPAAAGDLEAVLAIASNDPDQPLLEIVLEALGVVPEISADPEVWHLGSVVVSGEVSRTFRVVNIGGATLHVSDSWLTGADMDEITLEQGGGSFSLIPGASREYTLRFAPTSPGTKTAVLAVASNDPERPLLEILVTGQGMQASIPVLGGTGAVLLVLFLALASCLLLRRQG